MDQTSFPREKLRILLLENISEEAVRRFTDAGYTNIVRHSKALPEEELAAQIREVHVLGIRSKTQVSAAVLEQATRLLAIGAFCIGTDQTDLAAARDKGVVVFNAPFSNTRSVAELTIGAAIMLMRRVADKNKAAHEGIWDKNAAGCHELRGKTLGIIGYGNIGSQVSVLAEALGMQVIFYDVIKKLPLGNARAMPDARAVIEAADIVTLHTPSVPEMHRFINEETLGWFKPGAHLINYSRGEVADIDALALAVKKGHLAGAAVDVFPAEPEKNGDRFESPLQGLPNVLLTPHIGGSTEEAQVNIGVEVSDKILSYIESGNTQGSLTIPELSLTMQEGAHRILHIHRNVPGVLSEVNTTLATHGINILGQYLRTNEHIGYVVLDVSRGLSGNALDLLRAVKGTIRARILY